MRAWLGPSEDGPSLPIWLSGIGIVPIPHLPKPPSAAARNCHSATTPPRALGFDQLIFAREAQAQSPAAFSPRSLARARAPVRPACTEVTRAQESLVTHHAPAPSRARAPRGHVCLCPRAQVRLREYPVFFGALTATLTELFEPLHLNDNLTIPLLSSMRLRPLARGAQLGAGLARVPPPQREPDMIPHGPSGAARRANAPVAASVHSARAHLRAAPASGCAHRVRTRARLVRTRARLVRTRAHRVRTRARLVRTRASGATAIWTVLFIGGICSHAQHETITLLADGYDHAGMGSV
eukprot:4833880-Pleurochrysis_carterae.AAC.2